MTDSEVLREILENQRRMQATLDALTRTAAPQPEPLRADDKVGVAYFARVTGLSPVTIKQGKAGTDAVPLQGTRPKVWLKADVDRWQRERAMRLRSPKVKAERFLSRKRG